MSKTTKRPFSTKRWPGAVPAQTPPAASRRTETEGGSAGTPRPDVILAARERLKLADAARRRGEYARAQSICESLIDKHPNYAGALQALALVHMALGSYWEALSCLTRASMLNPTDWSNLSNLGQVYFGLDALEQAERALKMALEIKSDDAPTLLTLGQVHYEQREYELAAMVLRRAVSLDPSSPLAHIWLGKALAYCGQPEEAARAFTAAHGLDPDMLGTLLELTQLPRQFVTIDVGEDLRRVSGTPTDSNEDDAIRRAFIRAHLLDQEGSHDAAWSQIVEANTPLFERYSHLLAKHEQARAQKLRAATAGRIVPTADRDALPASLFILGVSRSGKTTLEQRISHLPAVKRGYESLVVEKAVAAASQLAGLLKIEHLYDLPPQLDSLFTESYVDELHRRARGARVFTSTHPGRISDVGRLVRCIPNAKFVFIERDRRDTALRILMKYYKKNTNPYAYNLRTAFQEIDWYHHMAAIWQSAIPQRCLTIPYRALVEDPVSQVTRVARLCGMDDDITDLPSISGDIDCSVPYRAFLAAAVD